MMSLPDDKQADTIDAFNTTSRYLDDILNIDNVYFDTMISQIYPSELPLNKVNTSDTEHAFRLAFVFFPFLDGDVLLSTYLTTLISVHTYMDPYLDKYKSDPFEIFTRYK